MVRSGIEATHLAAGTIPNSVVIAVELCNRLQHNQLELNCQKTERSRLDSLGPSKMRPLLLFVRDMCSVGFSGKPYFINAIDCNKLVLRGFYAPRFVPEAARGRAFYQ